MFSTTLLSLADVRMHPLPGCDVRCVRPLSLRPPSLRSPSSPSEPCKGIFLKISLYSVQAHGASRYRMSGTVRVPCADRRIRRPARGPIRRPHPADRSAGPAGLCAPDPYGAGRPAAQRRSAHRHPRGRADRGVRRELLVPPADARQVRPGAAGRGRPGQGEAMAGDHAVHRLAEPLRRPGRGRRLRGSEHRGRRELLRQDDARPGTASHPAPRLAGSRAVRRCLALPHGRRTHRTRRPGNRVARAVPVAPVGPGVPPGRRAAGQLSAGRFRPPWRHRGCRFSGPGECSSPGPGEAGRPGSREVFPPESREVGSTGSGESAS